MTINKNQKFVQVRLLRGKTSRVFWIPTELAIKNNFIKINDEDNWRIVEVGKKEVSRDGLIQHNKDFLRIKKTAK